MKNKAKIGDSEKEKAESEGKEKKEDSKNLAFCHIVKKYQCLSEYVYIGRSAGLYQK